MKIAIGILVIIAAVIGLVWFISMGVYYNYQYNNTIGSYWNLSVKASDLDVKSQYLDQFISAIEAANLSGNDALIFKTPDNSYTQNFNALLSLQTRMHAFVGQDPTTMAYQQAISQITAQEEDDNSSTINIINDLWWKSNHYIYWAWFTELGIPLGLIILGIIGIVIISI